MKLVQDLFLHTVLSEDGYENSTNGQTPVSNMHLSRKTVAKLLNNDRGYICKEIAHELDRSHVSVHCIFMGQLQMRMIAAQWVPHMLSESETRGPWATTRSPE